MISFILSSSSDVVVVLPDNTTFNYTSVTSFIINNTLTGIYKITITNGTYPPLIYNIYLDNTSYTLSPININITNVLDSSICSNYGIIYHPCKNYITILNTNYYLGLFKSYISINNNDWIESNNITISYIGTNILYSFKICEYQLVEVPDCCGSVIYEEEIIYCQECNDININIPNPNISSIRFFLDCTDNEVINIEKDKTYNICEGYCNYNCDCLDIKQCKCIPINYPILLKFEGNIFLTTSCSSVKVETFVNGEEIDEQNITSINDLLSLELVFEEKGKYNIRVELTDCCNTKCIYEQEIIVGADIFIKTNNCPQVYTLYNYKNYPDNAYKGKINIYDINNNLLTVFDLGILNNQPIYNFSLNGKQGIFIVEFIEESLSNSGTIFKYRYVIYDVCKLYECYLNKVKNILEKECIECNESDIKDNLLLCEYNALFEVLKINLDIIMKKSEGYYVAENIPLNYIYEIDYLINKLIELCGLNNNQSINTCC